MCVSKRLLGLLESTPRCHHKTLSLLHVLSAVTHCFKTNIDAGLTLSLGMLSVSVPRLQLSILRVSRHL
jgi:hypothetical protein